MISEGVSCCQACRETIGKLEHQAVSVRAAQIPGGLSYWSATAATRDQYGEAFTYMEHAIGDRLETINVLGFTPRQAEAWAQLASHRFLLYGGARGGGKSRFLRWGGIGLLMDHAAAGRRGVVGALFCSTYPELRDRQVSKIEMEFPKWLGDLRDSQQFGLAFHVAEEYGGGVLQLRNLDDPSKYKSSEFAFILIDELTQIADPAVFHTLRGSLRWAGVRRPQFIAADRKSVV